MNFGNILTSLTFRYMALYVLALSLAVFLVMAVIYGVFANNYFDDLQDSIIDELETLSLIYKGQGVAGVERYFSDRRSEPGARRFYYLLADADFEKIAGTLDAWPDYREFGDGWVAFGLELTEFGYVGAELELLARPATLDTGDHLLVALRYSDVAGAGRLVLGTLIQTMVATVLLGILGGFIAAASTLRRIESINEGISDIVHGDLSQRIPVGDAAGNMRELVENFNNMLDQTQSLMQGVRTVSDNIAHDLRTPLTRMRNQLSQLQVRVDVGNGERVQSLIEECDGILSTFNALLRIAQLEAGNRISEFRPLQLTALLADAVELYEPLASEKHIRIHTRCEAVQYDGDRDLLFQMMVNLVDNAVKYTPTYGQISISLCTDGASRPAITVADSGPGVPTTDRENVFRRFFRLEGSRSRQPGSGLGLSLVQAVVKLHRGRIQLMDNQPGLRVVVELG